MAVSAPASFCAVGCSLLPPAPRSPLPARCFHADTHVCLQYYIARGAIAAFFDYNIERMGGMSRERHTCVWSSGKCAQQTPPTPTMRITNFDELARTGFPVPPTDDGRRDMYQMMSNEGECSAACMDSSGRQVMSCPLAVNSASCSCAFSRNSSRPVRLRVLSCVGVGGRRHVADCVDAAERQRPRLSRLRALPRVPLRQHDFCRYRSRRLPERRAR